MSRCLLVLNSGSGGNQRGLDPDEVGDIVRDAFLAAGHQLEFRKVAPRDLSAAFSRAVAEDFDCVIAAGGDGTVASAAQILGGTNLTLGVLPMGTFNLAARDLGVPLDIHEAATMLATADDARIDVLDVAGHACLCTLVMGFYPEFAERFEDRSAHGGRWWRKSLALIRGIRTSVRQAHPLRLQWQSAEGEQGFARSKFAAFVPGRYRTTLGLLPLRELFVSGKLTAHIGRHRRASDALRGMLGYTVGKHEADPELTIIATSELTLRDSRKRRARVMVDGEIMRMKFPIVLRILPRHLRVLAGDEVIAGIEQEEQLT